MAPGCFPDEFDIACTITTHIHLTHIAGAANPHLGVWANVVACPLLFNEKQWSAAIATSLFMRYI